MATLPRFNSAFQQLMSVHWWMAAGYVLLFTGGYAMTHVPDYFPIKGGMYEFHNTVGVTSIALLTWRILVLLRVWGKKYLKRLPKLSPKWYLNTVLHTAMYVFMWVVPVSGVFLSNSYKAAHLKIFGFILLPDFFPENSAIVGDASHWHALLAYTLLCSIVLHTLLQWKVVKANWRRLQGVLQRWRSINPRKS
jgi:cytochrome b561